MTGCPIRSGMTKKAGRGPLFLCDLRLSAAVFLFFVEEALRHLAVLELLPLHAVAEDVAGGEDGRAHGARVGLVAAGHFVGRSVVGRGAHDGQAGGEVDAVLEGEGLEGREPLVVVHRQRGVEILEMVQPEVAVRGEGTEGEDALVGGFLDGGDDDVLLLGAEQAAVAAVRVEAEHRDARLVHHEVLLEGLVDEAQLAEDPLLGDLRGDVLEGNVARDNGQAQAVADHEHQGIGGAEGVLDVFGVAREAEALERHGLLVDGTRDEHVHEAGLEVGDGALERLDGAIRGFGRGLAGLGVGAFRQAADDVDALGVRLGGAVDGVGVHGLHLGDGLAVEAEELGGAIDDGSELLQDARVGEGLDDDLVADSVGVALGDAYYDFTVLHIVSLVYSNVSCSSFAGLTGESPSTYPVSGGRAGME